MSFLKRATTFACAILLSVTGLFQLASLQANALDANLIVNPSAETASSANASLPDGWNEGNWGTNNASFAYDTTGHAGSRSLKVQMTTYTNGDAKWYFNPVAITAGSQYTFSDYYQATVPTDLVAQFGNSDGTTSYMSLGTVAANSSWTQSNETFTAPTGSQNITIFHLLNAVGSLSTDDASLTSTVASTPSVSLTSPSASSTISGTVNLTANASDTNGISSVQFQLDSTNLGNPVTASPYQMSWDTTTASNGTHSLSVIARNSQGVSTTSSPVSVTVNNIVAVPPAGTNLVPNASVETVSTTNSSLPQNWQTGGWGTNTTTYSYLTTGAQNGSHSLQVKTTAYTNGDAKWYFTPQAVVVGGQYTFSDYYKSTIATDVMVQFDNGNGTYSYQDLGTTAASSTTWKQFSATFTIPAGMKNATVFHILSGVGTLQTDTFSMTQLNAPTVSVTAPVAGTVSGTSVALTATASDVKGIKSVQFKVDNTLIGAAVTASPYKTTWDSTTIANGTHDITAVATNAAGVSSTSPAVVVNINNAASGNLITNPSLETADPSNSALPYAWKSSQWGTNKATFSYLSNGIFGSLFGSVGHTGDHAVQVSMSSYTDGDAKWYFNPVAVTPDTQYRFSDYYKATIATEVDVAFTMSNGSTVYQIIGLPEASSSAWANFNTTFTVPQGAVSMTVYHVIHGNGTLTLDDANLQTYTPVGFSRPLVSLTFDDGYDNDATQAATLVQKYGFNSTQFIITSLVNTPGYVTSAQVKAMSDAGHEIGSHTVTHDNMLTETKTQYTSELANSKTQLQQWTGKTPTTLAFPNGLYNQAITTVTKQYYGMARGVENGLNSKDNFNAYDIKVQNIYDSTTSAQVADWVAQAQATRTWLVLVYHSVDPDLNNPVDMGIYNITPTQLDAQLAVIKNSGITVETMQQALAELKPQL